MSKIKQCLRLVTFAALIGCAVNAIAECSDCGVVAGQVSVWKTKVKTQGPKSYEHVIVYLESRDGLSFDPVTDRVNMDQRGLVFIPHVLAIQKGTHVRFLNNDTVDHNVYFLFEKTGETLDIGTWGQGISVDHRFMQNGPVIALCKLHLEMAAYIVVLDNPLYERVSIDAGSQQGSYLIENVPAGRYLVKAWHKKLKMKGGQAEILVTAGETIHLDVVVTKRKYAK